MRNSIRLLICLFLFAASVEAQTYQPDRFFAIFSDKAHTQYDLTEPAAFLSQRALKRRAGIDRAIDSLDLPVNRIYLDSLRQLGATVHLSSKWLNGAVFSVDSGTDITPLIALDFVKKVDTVRYQYFPPDIQNNGMQVSVETDRQQQLVQAPTGFEYGYADNQTELMNLKPLHKEGFKGEGVWIAVLDAGFYNVDNMQGFAHLFQDNRIISTKDFVDGDQYVFHGSVHGQLVLSIMAAWYPGIFAGSAPEASYILLRSEDTGSEYPVEELNWAAAAEYADSIGADIINSSLGYNTYGHPDLSYDYRDMDGNTAYVTRAADIAASRGILVVNSAGNDGENTWFRIGAPADGDSVLAVGAVDQLGRYAEFSSVGPAYDGDVKPNVAAVGKDTWFVNYNEQVGAGNGTSFAAPLLAGASACLWQAFPELSNMDIFDLIQKSSSRYLNPDSLTGHGIPDFQLAAVLQRENEIQTKPGLDAMIIPNPFDDYFYLVTKMVLQNPVFEIYDMNGRLVERYTGVTESQSGLYKLSGLDHYDQGLYLLRVSTSSTSFVLKLSRTF